MPCWRAPWLGAFMWTRVKEITERIVIVVVWLCVCVARLGLIQGRYCVQLYKDGDWTFVYVDDRIPCNRASQVSLPLPFPCSVRCNTWPVRGLPAVDPTVCMFLTPSPCSRWLCILVC